MTSGADYPTALAEWRKAREDQLLADRGWLSVSGLFWLKAGANRAGAGEACQIRLPSGSAPRRIGVFELRNGKIRFTAEPGVEVHSGGKPVASIEMVPDDAGEPTLLRIAALSMHVIHRGGRYAIRLTDRNNPMRRGFQGLKFYPADPRYRVTARFTPYDPPKTISVLNVVGDTERHVSPGKVRFELAGQSLELEPVWSGKRLFFIFKDLTSGKGAYPAGRFLYTGPPEDGAVVLDFNKAENPPCAFTPYATCPLPPRQNQLPISIPAGEREYHP